MDTTSLKNIKNIFQLEISNGSINWEKFSKKLFIALDVINTAKGKVTTIDGKVVTAKLSDAVTFNVGNKCYKIFSPRFFIGTFYCSGFQIGFRDKINGKPVFISPPVRF